MLRYIWPEKTKNWKFERIWNKNIYLHLSLYHAYPKPKKETLGTRLWRTFYCTEVTMNMCWSSPQERDKLLQFYMNIPADHFLNLFVVSKSARNNFCWSFSLKNENIWKIKVKKKGLGSMVSASRSWVFRNRVAGIT